MTRVASRVDPENTGSLCIENLLAAGLAMGLLCVSISLTADSIYSSTVRLAAGSISVMATSFAFISALTHSRRKNDMLTFLAFVYFVLTGVQHLTRAETLGAIMSLVGALLAITATQANLDRLFSGLRRWFLILVIVALMPAFAGQGFETGRVWFALVPGRYFGASNPDALGFIAGLAILLSLPVLRGRLGRALFLLGGLLFVLTATYTTAIAAGLAVAVYFFLIKIKSTRSLKWYPATLGLATVGALNWISTPEGIATLKILQQNFSLSNRTLIWVQLLEISQGSGYFWTGVGETAVAMFTRQIKDVASAHSTLVQMLLSAGVIVTVFFILIAVIVAFHTLSRLGSESTSSHRLAVSLVVYWFVTSLVSTQPGTATVLSLIIAVALSRSYESLPPNPCHNANGRQVSPMAHDFVGVDRHAGGQA